MRREDLTDLAAFAVIAEEKSFTRAATKLATSQSALSHTIRRLETRLGVRLLTRTTRSVAPTKAGERLLGTLVPALQSIDSEVATLSDLRGKPTGTIRITTSRHAAQTVLWPILARLLPDHPDIHVELSIDSETSDIVSDGFDAGVRLGEALVKDLIAVQIGPELRMAVVGSPGYFADRTPPTSPEDLATHSCINLRLAGGDFQVWELERDEREVSVRVDGQVAFDDVEMVIKAAEAGLGLGFVMEDQVAAGIESGALVRVLDDWCPPFMGYHLYHPSRQQPSAAFTLLVDALRFRG